MTTEQDADACACIVVELKEECLSIGQVESGIDGFPVVETSVRHRG